MRPMPNMASVAVTMIQVHIAIPGSNPGEWQFLLLKRAADEIIYPGIWQIVTGGIANGETALQAALREVQEETSLTPNQLWTVPYVGSFFDAEHDYVHLIPCFGCIATGRDIHLSCEHQESRWCTLGEAMGHLVMPSHREGTKVFYDYLLAENRPPISFPSNSPGNHPPVLY